MKSIYEPGDIKLLPAIDSVEPHVEIIPTLRLHFHPDGVTFGLIDPRDDRFAIIISFEEARRMMLQEMERQGEKEKRWRWNSDEAIGADQKANRPV